MTKILVPLCGLAFFAFASTAHAQATRTWVSGVGDDANPCSRTAPCKTFAGAISKTATGGEIDCLDPGGFGTLTISKSITVDCGPYTMGGVLSANLNGFIVNGAGANVTLRGLTIDAVGTTSGNGIRILNAAAVNIENVVIENFGGSATNGRGITIETTGVTLRVNVLHSRIYNNHGIVIHSNPTGGSVRLVVEDTHIDRGGASGIQIGGSTTVSVDNSSITNNAGDGFLIEQSTSTASISNSLLASNANGVTSGFAGGTPTTRLYANVITGNTTNGLLLTSGTVISLGNNMIRGNAGNEAASSTIATN